MRSLHFSPLARAVPAIVLVTALAVSRAVAAPACAGSFSQSSEPAVFDGLAFDLVCFESHSITLLAFTLGAWAPDKADASGRFGYTLRHQNHPAVHMGFCGLARNDLPSTDDKWAAYVAAVAHRLGPDATMSDDRDSHRDEGAVEVLGFRTREIKFTAPARGDQPALVEWHVVACDHEEGAAFVLTGTAEEVEKTLPDFRFVLSRLAAR